MEKQRSREQADLERRGDKARQSSIGVMAHTSILNTCVDTERYTKMQCTINTLETLWDK